MTPERKKEIKRRLNNDEYVFWEHGEKISFPVDDVKDLLAALEEAEKATDHERDRKYIRMMERDNARKELAEAQQTIARQQQELIKSQTDADILLQMNRQLRKSIREGAKES